MKGVTQIRASREGVFRFSFSEPSATGGRPAIFLDRDGVINERVHGGYVTQWSEFRFTPGVEKALAELSAFGFPIIVVSNQAGVGKGLVTLDALAEITERFVSELRQHEARVDAVYYCPHVAEAGCACRKPGTGLLRQAAEDWRIDLRRSVFVGDSVSDLQAAQASQCRAIFLAPEDPQSAPESIPEQLALTVQNVGEIVAGVRRLLHEVKES